jgi:hypothetical protein
MFREVPVRGVASGGVDGTTVLKKRGLRCRAGSTRREVMGWLTGI